MWKSNAIILTDISSPFEFNFNMCKFLLGSVSWFFCLTYVFLSVIQSCLQSRHIFSISFALIPLNLKFAGEDKHVVFVSGLSVGGSTSNPLQFQLLIDHITGHLGDEKVHFVFSFSLLRWFIFFALLSYLLFKCKLI